MKRQTYREEAIQKLKEYVKPGDTIHTILRHVTKSGMTRYIEPLVFVEGRPVYITYWANEVLGWGGSSKHEGVKVGGCGMDMGFHLVYSLSRALYSEAGYECLNDAEGNGKCPSNYHVNSRPYDGTNKGEPVHHDGYAIKHRWL